MNKNQVFAILKILGSFRCNNVKFFKFFIQTTFVRFETTYIIKKFNKKKFEFLNIFRCKTTLMTQLVLINYKKYYYMIIQVMLMVFEHFPFYLIIYFINWNFLGLLYPSLVYLYKNFLDWESSFPMKNLICTILTYTCKSSRKTQSVNKDV